MTSDQPDKPVFAARGNRAAAFLLDLMLLVVIGAFAAGQPFASRTAFALTVLLYFWLMPLTPLQGTLGKWICRIRLADRSGRRLDVRTSGLRALAFTAWFALAVAITGRPASGALGEALRVAVWFILPLPWMTLGFLPRRESLFDIVAGTLVVRIGSSPESVADAPPVQAPGILNVASAVLACALFGIMMSIPILAMHDRDFRSRVAYANAATDELKKKVAAFHARERRWPEPADIGVAEWTPYPDGGGYRLQKDGSIAINFTVLPELKELVITWRPVPSADGKRVEWTCTSTPAKAARYVPAGCR